MWKALVLVAMLASPAAAQSTDRAAEIADLEERLSTLTEGLGDERAAFEDLVRRYVETGVEIARLRTLRLSADRQASAASAARQREDTQAALERSRLRAERRRLERTERPGSFRLQTIDRRLAELERRRLGVPTGLPTTMGRDTRELDAAIVRAELRQERYLDLAAAYGTTWDEALALERQLRALRRE